MKIIMVTCWLSEFALEGWYNWFARRGIPCAMVQDKSRKNACCVWRRMDDAPKADVWYSTYKIVKSANGFKTS